MAAFCADMSDEPDGHAWATDRDSHGGSASLSKVHRHASSRSGTLGQPVGLNSQSTAEPSCHPSQGTLQQQGPLGSHAAEHVSQQPATMQSAHDWSSTVPKTNLPSADRGRTAAARVTGDGSGLELPLLPTHRRKPSDPWSKPEGGFGGFKRKTAAGADTEAPSTPALLAQLGDAVTSVTITNLQPQHARKPSDPFTAGESFPGTGLAYVAP